MEWMDHLHTCMMYWCRGQLWLIQRAAVAAVAHSKGMQGDSQPVTSPLCKYYIVDAHFVDCHTTNYNLYKVLENLVRSLTLSISLKKRCSIWHTTIRFQNIKLHNNNNNVQLSCAYQINALSAHMIHINLNMTFYVHMYWCRASPTKTIYIIHKVLYGETNTAGPCTTHTHTQWHTHTTVAGTSVWWRRSLYRGKRTAPVHQQ